MIAAFPIYTRFPHPSQDEPSNRFLEGDSPLYSIYRTKDNKRVSLAAIEPHFVSVVLNRVGGIDRNALSQWFGSKTLKEVLEAFSGFDACIEPVIPPWEAPLHLAFKPYFAPLNAPEGTFLLPVTPYATEIPKGCWVKY